MSYLAEALKHGRRPNANSKNANERRLGTVLINYTRPGTHDPVFDAKVRGLRPDWFANTADTKKEKLLKLAKTGAKRPSKKTQLGTALGRYTNKSSQCYDPVFDKEIIGLRPDWFENTADKNKKKLLELARSGTDRPNHRSDSSTAERRLDSSLHSYIHKSSDCYDPIFDEEIHKLRPDWFMKQSDKIKNELLELAKSGAKRPSQNSKDETTKKLGRALCRYIGIYRDPVFDKKIRELRPDWFRSTTNES